MRLTGRFLKRLRDSFELRAPCALWRKGFLFVRGRGLLRIMITITGLLESSSSNFLEADLNEAVVRRTSARVVSAQFGGG